MSVPADRVTELLDQERTRFAAERPRSAQLGRDAAVVMPHGVPMCWMSLLYEHQPLWIESGRGAILTDVDGHTYADFNIADTSAFGGHAPEPTTRAVAERLASGGQFLLPVEDAIWVATELGRRYRLPSWQFTLAASSANVEAIRLARRVTGRELVLVFDGHYHGAADDFMVKLDDAGRPAPYAEGVTGSAPAGIRVVSFNDPDALRRALADERVACVVAEPAMTNLQGLIQPQPGFHDQLRAATRDTGTLLVLDETHTQVCGPGGLTGRLGLDPDIVTLGKSIGGGVPVGAWGMRAELAAAFERDGWEATGGTLFGSALQMAACRATLEQVLTDDAYERTGRLGGALADGIDRVAADAGLPWQAHRLYARSGYSFTGTHPRDAVEARAGLDRDLWALLRVWHANRGVWEAIEGAGPTVSVAMEQQHVDRYLDSLSELVGALTGSRAGAG